MNLQWILSRCAGLHSMDLILIERPNFLIKMPIEYVLDIGLCNGRSSYESKIGEVVLWWMGLRVI
jgi:hypothetical protein